MNDPMRNTRRTTWTRLSSLIDEKPALITSNAPDSFSVKSNRIAPKTIQRISVAVNTPAIVAAPISSGLMSQPT